MRQQPGRRHLVGLVVWQFLAACLIERMVGGTVSSFLAGAGWRLDSVAALSLVALAAAVLAAVEVPFTIMHFSGVLVTYAEMRGSGGLRHRRQPGAGDGRGCLASAAGPPAGAPTAAEPTPPAV